MAGEALQRMHSAGARNGSKQTAIGRWAALHASWAGAGWNNIMLPEYDCLFVAWPIAMVSRWGLREPDANEPDGSEPLRTIPVMNDYARKTPEWLHQNTCLKIPS